MIKLLLLPVLAMALCVPFFNRVSPVLFGFPLFYWYQIVAVPAGALLIFIVYLVEERGRGDEA
ncbi:MAG: DUF3311 domain-containing protein [Acidocella sp.]|nr:DUF3311 domain-containing protein [Acidocella sp.]